MANSLPVKRSCSFRPSIFMPLAARRWASAKEFPLLDPATQARGTAEFLLYSEDKLSLDAMTLASGENLSAGAVVGAKTKRQAAAPSRLLMGTGTASCLRYRSGRMSRSVAKSSPCWPPPLYCSHSRCAVDRNGVAIANGAVGTAYSSSHLSFLISNSSTMTNHRGRLYCRGYCGRYAGPSRHRHRHGFWRLAGTRCSAWHVPSSTPGHQRHCRVRGDRAQRKQAQDAVVRPPRTRLATSTFASPMAAP